MGISNKVWGGKITKYLGVVGLGRSLEGLGDVHYAVQVPDNKVPNCPVGPVVDIGATDANRIHPQKNLTNESLKAKQLKGSKYGFQKG